MGVVGRWSSVMILLVGLVVALSGCAVGLGGAGGERSPAPWDDGIKVSDCIAPVGSNADGSQWREVWCTDPAAVAEVTNVEYVSGNQQYTARPSCPSDADFGLGASNFLPEQLGAQATKILVCARNLTPPT